MEGKRTQPLGSYLESQRISKEKIERANKLAEQLLRVLEEMRNQQVRQASLFVKAINALLRVKGQEATRYRNALAEHSRRAEEGKEDIGEILVEVQGEMQKVKRVLDVLAHLLQTQLPSMKAVIVEIEQMVGTTERAGTQEEHREEASGGDQQLLDTLTKLTQEADRIEKLNQELEEIVATLRSENLLQDDGW